MVDRSIDFDINKAVTLAHNEVIINSYEGFETINPRGKGYFAITNFRFLYFAVSKDNLSNSISVSQWDINGIGGITSEAGKRVKIIQRIVAIVLLLAGITGIGYSLYRVLIFNFTLTIQLPLLIVSGVALLVSMFLFIFGKHKMFSLEVLTNTASTSLVSLTSSFFRSPNDDKILIRPSASTFRMIREIGKTILEAQQFHKNINRFGEENEYRTRG